MALFSERHELARASLIVDDAPRWFRSTFYHQVIKPYVLISMNRTDETGPDRPISPHWFMERLSQLCRQDIGRHYLKPGLGESQLDAFLMSCEWFFFFDAIEIAGRVILDKDKEYSWKKYDNFSDFRKLCNGTFETSGIGWKLDQESVLFRTQPEELVIAEAQLATIELHSPAKVHIAKARLMLRMRPCDAANAIKESVSAIESAGCQAYPKTSTLGDVLKEMKKDANSPPMFIAMLEKLYAFASAEPGVRHGSSGEERVTRAEAEFIFTIALSTISYLEALGLL